MPQDAILTRIGIWHRERLEAARGAQNRFYGCGLFEAFLPKLFLCGFMIGRVRERSPKAVWTGIGIPPVPARIGPKTRRPCACEGFGKLDLERSGPPLDGFEQNRPLTNPPVSNRRDEWQTLAVTLLLSRGP